MAWSSADLDRASDLLATALAPADSPILQTDSDGTAATFLFPHHRLRLIDPDAPAPAGTGPWAWLVPRATRRQRQHWRDHDENFIDLSGAVRLRLLRIHVDRTDLAPTGRPSATSPAPHTRNPFGDRASLVVRTLLEEPRRTWTTTALAKTANVSPATVSLVTETLRAANLLRVERQGRERDITMENPAAIFPQWARRYDWTRNTAVAFAAPVGAPERFLRKLPSVLGPASVHARRRPRLTGRPRWALTLQAGASLIAPHARWDTIHVYVDVDEAAQLITLGTGVGWRPSPTGSVVLLLPYYRTSVWDHTKVRDGLNVVSRTQLILDLWDYPVRGREQAEHLLRTSGWLATDE
jgi:hypothetical protein